MAIAFRAAATTHSGTGTGSTVSFTKPTGTVSGDVLIASLNVAGGTAIDITPPSGFTQINRQDNTNVTLHSTFVKVAGGSEPATYDFAVVLTGTSTASSRRYAATALAYEGVDNANPVNTDNENTATGTAATTTTSPTVTTTATNTVLLHCYAARSSVAAFTFTEDGATAERSDTCNTAVASPWLGSTVDDETQAAAGLSTGRTVTATQTAIWLNQTIALKPAISGETPTPGGAIGAGNSPSASVSMVAGGGVAEGVAPTGAAGVTAGGGTGGGNAPSAIVSVSIGGGVGGGNAPSDGSGLVTETPTPGGGLGGGAAPSPRVLVAAGGGVGGGVGATVRVAVTRGGGVGGGYGPTNLADAIHGHMEPGGGVTGNDEPGSGIIGRLE